MLLLIEHPEHRRMLLDDMSLLPGTIEECLRYRPAVIHFRRTATRDLVMRGKTIREGDKVTVWYPSANRDEEVFEEPDRFDIRRSVNEHLAFGVGEHFCLGASLARLQLLAIFETLLPRLPDMELAGPVRRLRSNFIDGIKEMPVCFTPQPGDGRDR
jgi:cytochrome P450